ncbi:hypothetical protein C8R43DRAFT_876507, partial [Mycena crocata]
MQRKDWGPMWQELVDAVILFEESMEQRKGKLPARCGRPDEIGAWMKDHRKPGDYEKLEAGFGERVVAWWRAIGPVSRSMQRPDSIPENVVWPLRGLHRIADEYRPAEWANIRQSGDNGILLVVQALMWW